MDNTKILYTIINLMENIELSKKLNGLQKKEYVLNELKKILQPEIYERYEPFILLFINIIINISRGLKLNINKNQYCCF